MRAHRVETRVGKGGELGLKGLPFGAGEEVEVIVLSRAEGGHGSGERYPLRGTPFRYTAPVEPVAADEWEVRRS